MKNLIIYVHGKDGSAQEALAYGLIDRIIDKKEGETLCQKRI